MANELMAFNYESRALCVEKAREDYIIHTPSGSETRLKRGTDFGVIRKKNGDLMTKNPTLFKPGAEKVAVAYGLLQHYTTESAAEDYEKGFFFYRVRCDLVKICNGTEYIITSAMGSANTREGRTGGQSPYDGANSALKMAQKRALVSAALSLGCMSDSFTQDIESDTEAAGVYFTKDPKAKITSQQITYFYTAAGRHGLSKKEAKEFLKSHNYDSAKDILQKDLNALIDAMDDPEYQQSKDSELIQATGTVIDAEVSE